MSWKIFKNNMSLYMKNQGGIKSSDDFAEKLTNEYDMCVRRGLQTANQVPIMTPNKPLIKPPITPKNTRIRINEISTLFRVLSIDYILSNL